MKIAVVKASWLTLSSMQLFAGLRTCLVLSATRTCEVRTTEDASPKFAYLVLRNARRPTSPDLISRYFRPRWKRRQQQVWGKKFLGQIVQVISVEKWLYIPAESVSIKSSTFCLWLLAADQRYMVIIFIQLWGSWIYCRKFTRNKNCICWYVDDAAGYHNLGLHWACTALLFHCDSDNWFSCLIHRKLIKNTVDTVILWYIILKLFNF